MIELNFTLSKEDNYIFQLYVASKNPIIKKQRRIGRFIALALIALMGFILLDINAEIAYCFFALSIIFFFLYSFYFRWFYKRHYKKYVNQYFDPNAGTITFRLGEETLNASDKKGNSSIYPKELLSFVEIEGYFLIQMAKVIYYIIPKKQVDEVGVRQHLQKWSVDFSIPYISELDWKWK